jgi:hypothetical protein
MTPLRFSFVLHLHQPVGNFDHVFREHADDVYTPFFDFLEERALWPIGLHVSGPLLEWLASNDARLHDRIGRLVADGHIELLSAGWYEPILAALPRRDRAEQLEWMRAELERRFGFAPSGAWLTERVWEADLAADLADAGIRYALIDDHLALRAGVAPEDLVRPLRTEADGRTLDLFAIDEGLRYLIPFRPADEIAADLRRRHAEGAELALFGDDGEKFGGWPRTKAWLYEGGWLEAFGDRMDELRADGIVRCTAPGQAHAEIEAVGPVYLPAGSYAEMEGWARGGHWKGFLSRYPEANRIHKRMLGLSELSRERGDPEDVRRAIGRAQCNDAYWHGVFGGLYMKHLREGVRGQLLLAERGLREGERLAWSRLDVDADGREEWWVHGESVSAWVRADGSIVDLLWLTEGTDVLDVLTRTREEYHEEAHRRWNERMDASGGEAHFGDAPSIHDVEEAAMLETLPPIDAETRTLVRERVLPAGLSEDAYSVGGYEPVWVGTAYAVVEEPSFDSHDREADRCFVLRLLSSDRRDVEKTVTVREDGSVTYEWRWVPERFPPGTSFAPEISLGADVPVSWSPDADAWTWPIITLSKCPDGFEEIEQGSSVTPLWPIESGRARIDIGHLGAARP